MLIWEAATIKWRSKLSAMRNFYFDYMIIKVSFQEIWRHIVSETRETCCGTQDFWKLYIVLLYILLLYKRQSLPFDCIFELGLPVETFHERILSRALTLIVAVKQLGNAKCLLEGLMQWGEGAQVETTFSQFLNCSLSALTMHIILMCEHSTMRPLINMLTLQVEA